MQSRIFEIAFVILSEAEATSKNPVERLLGSAAGLKAWPGPESVRGCVAASTSLGITGKCVADLPIFCAV
jgi:hypothetical protein